MALDALSPLLKLLLMGTGNDNNSWGDNANTQIFLRLENAIADQSSIDMSAGTRTLTDDESLRGTIILSGTITADAVLTVPATRKTWKIFNLCSGNFFVLVKTAAGNSINVPVGKFTDVISDGANNLYRCDRHQVGRLFFHAGASPPPGAIECNGAFVKRLSAPDLFTAIGTTWGVGDNSTTFQLPDAVGTGRFVRSRTSGVGVGTYQANQNKLHSHTGSGTTGGQSQNHTHGYSGTTGTENNAHNHQYTGSAGNTSTPGGGFPAGAPVSTNTTGTENQAWTHNYSGTTGFFSSDHLHSYSFTTSSDGGAEARPEALVGILCIEY